MIAFTGSGSTLWTGPSDTPQIATQGDGVIGTSGTTYDSNGNVTGQSQVYASGGWTDWQGQLYTSGSSGAQLNYSFANLDAGYPIAGGNPSGGGTFVLNIGTYESVPMWASLGGAPKCVLGSSKIALGSGVATKYNQLVLDLYTKVKQAMISGGYLGSQKCSILFVANPSLTPYFSQLTNGIQTLNALDGLQSNLSMYSAGLGTTEQLNDPATLANLQKDPVCSQYSLANGDWNGIVASAQVQPPATDVYFYTGKQALKNITQSTLLHETLHRLTGKNDHDLYKLLTGKELEEGKPTDVINQALVQNGCANQ